MVSRKLPDVVEDDVEDGVEDDVEDRREITKYLAIVIFEVYLLTILL